MRPFNSGMLENFSDVGYLSCNLVGGANSVNSMTNMPYFAPCYSSFFEACTMYCTVVSFL